jgi:hypothetical protein
MNSKKTWKNRSSLRPWKYATNSSTLLKKATAMLSNSCLKSRLLIFSYNESILLRKARKRSANDQFGSSKLISWYSPFSLEVGARFNIPTRNY